MRKSGPNKPDPPNRSAYGRAVKLLARSPRTEKELEKRLAKEGFEQTDIREAMQKLKHQSWLDDRQLAQSWLEIRAASSPVGPAWARGYLGQRGVPAETANEVISAFFEEHPELESALKLAASWFRTHPEGTREQLLRFLARRGFSTGACLDAVEAFSDRQGFHEAM